jgi:hypothetical protein
MSALAIREGPGAYGVPVMKFTLTFEGELGSNSRPVKKWEIRKYLHPQLQELWRINPTLQHVLRNRQIPKEGAFFVLEKHHSVDENKFPTPQTTERETIDLCVPIVCGGREFIPLVRDSYALNCALKIIFLRKEEPGRVYQGGDLDNRLKTLFDALAIPSADQIIDDPSIDGPIFCLMENDRMITGLSVETHRLLSRPNVSKHHVQLIIEVDVRVAQARIYNQHFLGD